MLTNKELGLYLRKIRENCALSLRQVGNQSSLSYSHLSMIENGTRKPSHKSLKTITQALEVPYQPLFSTFDKELAETQIAYDYIKHVSYNKIPAISEIDAYIECPPNFPNASFAYRVPDSAMSPIIEQYSYVFDYI